MTLNINRVISLSFYCSQSRTRLLQRKYFQKRVISFVCPDQFGGVGAIWSIPAYNMCRIYRMAVFDRPSSPRTASRKYPSTLCRDAQLQTTIIQIQNEAHQTGTKRTIRNGRPPCGPTSPVEKPPRTPTDDGPGPGPPVPPTCSRKWREIHSTRMTKPSEKGCRRRRPCRPSDRLFLEEDEPGRGCRHLP